MVEGDRPCIFRIWQCSIMSLDFKSDIFNSAIGERDRTRRELFFDEPIFMFG
ncbi:hypothetical protein KLMIMMO078B4_24315 [Klebsiella michiganensis]